MPDLREIEQDVERDRAQLSASLKALTDTVAPSRISDSVGSLAKEYGGEIGDQTWAAVKSNPAAFALVGAGLGLLLTGGGTRPARVTQRTPQANSPTAAMTGVDARVAAADAEIKQEMTGTMSDTHKAKRMRASLERGLDKLPDAARKRVLKARKSALQAQEQLEKHARRAANHSRTFHHQQPLAIGALALGMGALIGALLPATRREDELLGEHRDALMAKAQDTFDEEVSRLSATAQTKLRDVARSAQSSA